MYTYCSVIQNTYRYIIYMFSGLIMFICVHINLNTLTNTNNMYLYQNINVYIFIYIYTYLHICMYILASTYPLTLPYICGNVVYRQKI